MGWTDAAPETSDTPGKDEADGARSLGRDLEERLSAGSAGSHDGTATMAHGTDQEGKLEEEREGAQQAQVGVRDTFLTPIGSYDIMARL